MKFFQVVKMLCMVLLFSSCMVLDESNEPPKSERKLNLSRKSLRRIPDYVFEMQNLQELKLYENELTTIPKEITKLKQLRKLYLGKNQLTHLPGFLGELEHLELISAQYNEIDSISPDLKNAKQLNQLILNNNKLKSLPSTLGELPQLEYLWLNFNELEYLPDSMFNAGSLLFISLNRNFLEEIPMSISKCKNLKELRMLNAGALVKLPESICEIRRMDILEIDKQVEVPQCLLIRQTTPLRIILR